MLKIKGRTKIYGLLEIYDEKFTDNRGDVYTIFNNNALPINFVEDKVSISHIGVLRGLHGDFYTNKLVSCLHGFIYLVVVDMRENSSTYRNSEYFYMGANNPKSIYIPSGCLNGHYCLEDNSIFHYKLTEYYKGPDKQMSIKWNDPTLNLKWPTRNPILSDRDKNAMTIEEYEKFRCITSSS